MAVLPFQNRVQLAPVPDRNQLGHRLIANAVKAADRTTIACPQSRRAHGSLIQIKGEARGSG